MAQVMAIASDVSLFTTPANTVRQSIVPPDEALKIPASFKAVRVLGVPAGKVATYVTVAPDTVEDVKATRADSVPRVVSPAAAAVEPVPTAI